MGFRNILIFSNLFLSSGLVVLSFNDLSFFIKATAWIKRQAPNDPIIIG